MDRDPHKPNYIFSSDIPSKVKALVRRYRRKLEEHEQGQIHHDRDQVSLVDGAGGASGVALHVNVELNTFLLRNRKNIKPSDLAKDNLISIAKTSGRRRGVFGSQIDFKSVLLLTLSSSSLSAVSLPSSSSASCINVKNEIFILTLTLNLLDFVVLQDHTVVMEFVKDESYGIMVLCDYGLLDQLEGYIRWKFSEGLSSDMPNSSEEYIDDLNESTDLSLADISIDEDEYEIEIEPEDKVDESVDTSSTMNSDTNGKSFLYEDEHEFNSSVEELNILQSNDITRSNTQDDEDDELNDGENEHDEGVRSRLKVIREESTDKFLKEISNLRHNDLPLKGSDLPRKDSYDQIGDEGDEGDRATLILDSISDVECDLDDEEAMLASPTKAKLDQNSKYNHLSYLQPAFQLRKASPSSYNNNANYKLPPPNPPSLPLPPPNKRNGSFVSPRRGRQQEKVLLNKTLAGSLSMVKDEDEASGLEYAFRDRSPTVPSYIRQDKKFKFIKVGKVQKFVNLFEEKKPEDTGTGGVPTPNLLRQLLYSSVRTPSSPIRKEPTPTVE